MPFFSSPRKAGVPSRLIEKRVLLSARTASAVRFNSGWTAAGLAPGFSCSALTIQVDDASRQSRTLAAAAFLMFVGPRPEDRLARNMDSFDNITGARLDRPFDGRAGSVC